MNSEEWLPCLADAARGIAFFDGVRINADSISSPRHDRVLPVREEEHIFMCRQMKHLLQPGLRALDIGTGNGVYAVWAAKFGCAVIAIDISPRALSIAYENAKENKVRIVQTLEDLTDAAIHFQLGVFDDEFCERSRFQNQFDLIFLSPPFVATCPGISTAAFAEAGENSQAPFKAMISIASKMLTKTGTCIGIQLSPVHDDRVLALGDIEKSFSQRCHIRYARTIPGDVSTRIFLESQYRKYLTSALRSPSPNEINTYIQRTYQDDPKLALIYYEVSNSPEFTIEEISPVRRPAITWEDREWLHREIVGHPASISNFPSAALFISTDPVIEIRDSENKQATSSTSDGRHLLDAFAEWVNRNELLSRSSPDGLALFDMIGVEALPIFSSLDGRKGALREVKVCLSDQALQDHPVVDDILSAWKHITRLVQAAQVGTVMHKHFVRAKLPNVIHTLWGRISNVVTINRKEVTLNDPKRARLLELAEERLRQADTEQMEQRSRSSRDKVKDLEAGYLSVTLADVEVVEDSKLRDYWDAIEQRLAQVGLGSDIQSIQTDAEICSAASHIRFHRSFNQILRKYERPLFNWSVKIGIPLALATSDRNTESLLPESYRGGVWLYAGSSAEWTMRHEELLLDAARLLWLLYNGQSNLQATLVRGVDYRRRAMTTSGHEAGAQLEAVRNLFPFREQTEIKDIIDASLTYSHLYLSDRPKSPGLKKLLPLDEKPLSEWLKDLLPAAWAITVAREARATFDAQSIRHLIPRVLKRYPDQVRIDVPDGLSVALDQFPNHPFLAWDLTRWMLTALTNAIKWSGPGSDKASGTKMLREYWLEGDFRPIILRASVSELQLSISIFNGCYQAPLLDKLYGTLEVLTAITEVLPEESHFRFSPVSREALADILPLEQFGFDTSLFTKSKLVRMNNS